MVSILLCWSGLQTCSSWNTGAPCALDAFDFEVPIRYCETAAAGERAGNLSLSIESGTFLMVPLMPDTVRMAAPSNLATSRGLLNMPEMKAVFFMILVGAPVSLSFFTTLGAASRAVTTPVALIRHPCNSLTTLSFVRLSHGTVICRLVNAVAFLDSLLQ